MEVDGQEEGDAEKPIFATSSNNAPIGNLYPFFKEMTTDDMEASVGFIEINRRLC